MIADEVGLTEVTEFSSGAGAPADKEWDFLLELALRDRQGASRWIAFTTGGLLTIPPRCYPMTHRTIRALQVTTGTGERRRPVPRTRKMVNCR